MESAKIGQSVGTDEADSNTKGQSHGIEETDGKTIVSITCVQMKQAIIWSQCIHHYFFYIPQTLLTTFTKFSNFSIHVHVPNQYMIYSIKSMYKEYTVITSVM